MGRTGSSQLLGGELRLARGQLQSRAAAPELHRCQESKTPAATANSICWDSHPTTAPKLYSRQLHHPLPRQPFIFSPVSHSLQPFLPPSRPLYSIEHPHKWDLCQISDVTGLSPIPSCSPYISPVRLPVPSSPLPSPSLPSVSCASGCRECINATQTTTHINCRFSPRPPAKSSFVHQFSFLFSAVAAGFLRPAAVSRQNSVLRDSPPAFLRRGPACCAAGRCQLIRWRRRLPNCPRLSRSVPICLSQHLKPQFQLFQNHHHPNLHSLRHA